MSFDTALTFVLKEEGGYVNDKDDHGGATNHGITQKTYDTFRDTVHESHQDVQLITDSEVRQIYEMFYWEPSKAQIMHSPLDITHFDFSVNSGISRALKTLQAALGVSADGIWGPETASALAIADPVETSMTYNSLRRAFYENLATNPTQAKFLKGWLGRCDRLEAYCESI